MTVGLLSTEISTPYSSQQVAMLVQDKKRDTTLRVQVAWTAGMSAGAPATPAPVFAVRIVSLDHYMARPEPGLDVCYSELEGSVVERVPVVRIFGATPMGQKTCLHLHKVRSRSLVFLCTTPARNSGNMVQYTGT